MAKENETIADIIAEMRSHGQLNVDAEKGKPEYGILTVEGRIAQNYADRLESAHKREIDVLKQRCAELDAEVAAKDEVIKRLNDAIAEEQRRKMATAENSSAVGDAAKRREALESIISGYENADLCDMNYGEWCHDPANVCVNVPLCKAIHEARAALAAPPRNCDTKESIDAVVKRFKAENCDHYDNAIDDPRTQCHQNCVECVIKWMVAHYKEVSDGNK